MNDNSDEIEALLKKPYWVIDILPKQVPKDGRGQYFKNEQFFLLAPQMEHICQKFLMMMLKLNCYEDLKICRIDGDYTEWMTNPPAEALARWMYDYEPIYIVIENRNAMLIVTGEDHYMTLYNPDEEILQLVKQLAASEGLFVWNSLM